MPEPDPGPGHVVVRIGGAGACHSDLHLIHDVEPGMLPYELPFTLGHENAGWVHAVGAGVERLEVGEPVAVYGPWGCGRCHRCRRGMENYCENAAELGAAGGGLGRDGGMAPYQLVPSARLLGHLTVVGIGGGTLPFGFFGVQYEVSVATTYWGSVTELMEVLALAAGEVDGRAVIVPDAR